MKSFFNRASSGVAASVLALATVFYAHPINEAQGSDPSDKGADSTWVTKDTDSGYADTVQTVASHPSTQQSSAVSSIPYYVVPNGTTITQDITFFGKVLDFVDSNHVTGKADIKGEDAVREAMREVLNHVSREQFYDKNTRKFDTSKMTFDSARRISGIRFPSGAYVRIKSPNINFRSNRDVAVYLRPFIQSVAKHSGLSERSLYQAALEGVIKETRDQHTKYMQPDAFKEFIDGFNGSFVGAGFTMEDKSGQIGVKKVFPNSPAEKAGIKAGDIVTHVDGNAFTSDKMQDAISAIRGQSGTTVKITVERQGQMMDMSVVRGAVRVPSVSEQKVLSSQSDIAYVKLDRFSKGSYSELRAAATAAMKEAKGNGHHDIKLVLDLRGNGGGSLNEVIYIADMFMEEDGGARDVIVATGRTANDNKRYVDNYVPGRLGFAEVVILQDENSASASEILAGAMKDAGFEVVGQRSYGKGSVQFLHGLTASGNSHFNYDNAPGGGVKITSQLFFPGNSGLSNQGSGVIPNVRIVYNDFRDQLLAQHKFGSTGGKNSKLVDQKDTRASNTPDTVISLKKQYAGELTVAQAATIPEEFLIEARRYDKATNTYRDVTLFDADLAAAVYSITGKSIYLDIQGPGVQPAPKKVSSVPPVNPKLGLG